MRGKLTIIRPRKAPGVVKRILSFVRRRYYAYRYGDPLECPKCGAHAWVRCEVCAQPLKLLKKDG